jgi:hypothetical protein
MPVCPISRLSFNTTCSVLLIIKDTEYAGSHRRDSSRPLEAPAYYCIDTTGVYQTTTIVVRVQMSHLIRSRSLGLITTPASRAMILFHRFDLECHTQYCLVNLRLCKPRNAPVVFLPPMITRQLRDQGSPPINKVLGWTRPPFLLPWHRRERF